MSSSSVELARRYSPVFYLTTDECFYPIHIEDYVKACSIIDTRGCKVLKPFPSVKLDDLGNYQDKHTALQLVDMSIIGGSRYLCKTPIYTNIVTPGDGYIYVNYAAFYAFNGFFRYRNPCHSRKNYCIGGHTSDLEHVTLRIDEKTQLPESLLYSRHGAAEVAGWIKWDDLEKEDGKPVVYIARGSHGMYEKAGEWIRFYSLPEWVHISGFNDHTQKGYRWEPKIYLLTNQPFLRYLGTFGLDFPSGKCKLLVTEFDDGNPCQSRKLCGIRHGTRCNFDGKCPFGIDPSSDFTPDCTNGAVDSFVNHIFFLTPQVQKKGDMVAIYNPDDKWDYIPTSRPPLNCSGIEFFGFGEFEETVIGGTSLFFVGGVLLLIVLLYIYMKRLKK